MAKKALCITIPKTVSWETYKQELADFFYFSSLEESDVDAVILDMYDGDNDCLISKRISKYNGIEETCAIGFIQVSE